MIGDLVNVGGRWYLQRNEGGTLEILPRIKWWRQLWLLILNGLGKVRDVDQIRWLWR